MSVRDDVRREYEELKNRYRQISIDDLRRGDWLHQLVRWVLETYAKNVDADYLRRKYPGAGAANQAKKAIKLASQHAGIGGAVSAAAVTAAELSIPATGPLAVPAIAASIVADITFTTRLQLRTVFDLSVIHRGPLSLNDAEDATLILGLAVGIRLGQSAGDLAKSVSPKIIIYNARKILRAGVRKFIIEVLKKLIGPIARKITEKALLRILVPGINIPLSYAMNRAFTKQLLRRGEVAMRRRGAVVQPLIRLFQADPDLPREIVIRSLISLMETAGRGGCWDEEQLDVLRHTQSTLSLADSEIAGLEDWFDRSIEDLVSTLPAMSAGGAEALLDYLATAAALARDSQGDAAYAPALHRVAMKLGVAFDDRQIASARAQLEKPL